MNRDIVVIEEIEVPVYKSDPVLLDNETFIREIGLLTSETENRQNVSRATEALLRAFQNYKILASPTKPYPSYAGITDPIFVFEYDRIVVLDTVTETSDFRRSNNKRSGFDPRTLISELKSWKKFKGQNRARIWSTVTSSKTERVQVARDPVEMECETSKCSSMILSQGKWTSVLPEWTVGSASFIRLLPGDKAYLSGVKGFPKRNDGESELEYYSRIRPSAKILIESNDILSATDADKFGVDIIFDGFKYDINYSRSLRREMDNRAKKVEKWEVVEIVPDGLFVSHEIPIPVKRSYSKRKRQSGTDDIKKKIKVIQKKLESSENALTKFAKNLHLKGSERGYVRVFDSFEKMRRELYTGLRGKEFDPTPFELKEYGDTVQAIKKAAGTKISKEVAENVLRGGKTIDIGDRVLLVDTTGRRDIFEKSKDPDGDLFWALKGTVAVSGIRPCDFKNKEKESSIEWEVCDIEHERIKSRIDSFKEALDFIDGGHAYSSIFPKGIPGLSEDHIINETIFYTSEGKYVRSFLESMVVVEYKWDVAGVNIPISIDEVILHPEYRDGYTVAAPQPDSDTQLFNPNVDEKLAADLGKDRDRDMDTDRVRDFDAIRDREFATDVTKSIISRSVDGMITGASYDLVGINTRVLKNMVSFSVSPFSDISTGDIQEQKARLLRLITSTLQFTVVFVTIARQIVDIELRNDKSRDSLIEIAISKAKTLDFSEFFSDRKSIRSAIDGKVTISSLKSIYDSELASSPLLKDMLSSIPYTSYTLTNAGRSLKNWVGFRPSVTEISKGKVSKSGENAFDNLRSIVRKTSTTAARSVAGFNKRGRCCQELIPSTEVNEKGYDKIRIEGSKTFNVPEIIDALFEDDIRRCLKNSYRIFMKIISNINSGNTKNVNKDKIVRAKPGVIDKTIKKLAKLEIDDRLNFEDIHDQIEDKEILELFLSIYKRNLKIAASDNSELSSRMESAREDRKQMQVSYVESMDQESKTAYFAQREIGIKLDEVMEYELQNQNEAEISKETNADVDDSHDFGDYELVTVEDDGNS